jgi:hypothetical protein
MAVRKVAKIAGTAIVGSLKNKGNSNQQNLHHGDTEARRKSIGHRQKSGHLKTKNKPPLNAFRRYLLSTKTKYNKGFSLTHWACQ